MNTRYTLRQQVINEAQERCTDESDWKTYNEVIDSIHEIIESSIPVYTADLLEIALSNLRLATAQPWNMPEDVDPVTLISLNIYELLCEEVQEWFDNTWGHIYV